MLTSINPVSYPTVPGKSFELPGWLAHWQTLLSIGFLVSMDLHSIVVDRDGLGDCQYGDLLKGGAILTAISVLYYVRLYR